MTIILWYDYVYNFQREVFSDHFLLTTLLRFISNHLPEYYNLYYVPSQLQKWKTVRKIQLFCLNNLAHLIFVNIIYIIPHSLFLLGNVSSVIQDLIAFIRSQDGSSFHFKLTERLTLRDLDLNSNWRGVSISHVVKDRTTLCVSWLHTDFVNIPIPTNSLH